MAYITKFHPWYHRVWHSVTDFFKAILYLISGGIAVLVGLGTVLGTLLIYLAIAALPILLVIVCLKFLFF